MEANVLGSLMQNGIGSAVTVPGAVSLLLFFVFSYLYSQSRANYFRAWQIGWAAFSAHYALDTWMLLRRPSAVGFFVSQLLLFIRKHNFHTWEEMVPLLPMRSRRKPWMNIGGQLIPKDAINSLIKNTKSVIQALA